jgi:hypothetical protein
MKNLNDFKALTALIFVTFIAGSTVFAQGTRDGGGGSKFLRNFMAVAREGIELVNKRAPGKYTARLEAALKGTAEADGIVFVKQLVDRQGRPLQDANLYAYSWPGKIQLLENPWLEWLETSDRAAAYIADVIHEVFRTVDVRMDDGFSISIMELGLTGSGLRQPYPCWINAPKDTSRVADTVNSEPTLVYGGSTNQKDARAELDIRAKAAIERLRSEYPDRQYNAASFMKWNPRIRYAYGAEQGYYSVDIIENRIYTAPEMKQTVCKQVLVCLLEAGPNADISWLIKKSETFGCNK